jgi:hypothetical protein
MAKVDIASTTKTDALAALSRMGAAVKRNKDKIKQKTQDTMGVALAAGGAGVAGWFMGGRAAAIEQDTSLVTEEQKEEKMKLFGYVDPDLAAGAALALAGLAGAGGKKSSGAMLSAGSGILSYYVGSKAFDVARARALSTEQAKYDNSFPRGA